MNEFDVLRKAFPETDGPTPEATDAARHQVEELIHQAKPARSFTNRRVSTIWSGGSGFLSQSRLGTPLMTAIRSVASGCSMVSAPNTMCHTAAQAS